ncbi:uncharacterized protein PG998_013651 [Apiospora kogelbergensis]|uniref:C2H2-type domain-containing protein n=1 Tax=Apiospora kogelbergensis TaxID=1337665 RepID=A0AAW0R0U2_9PEZI
MADDFVTQVCNLGTDDLRQIVLGLCLEPKNKDAVVRHVMAMRKQNGGSGSGHGQVPPSQPSAGSRQQQRPAPAAETRTSNTAGPTHNATVNANGNGIGHRRRRSSVHTTPYTRQRCQNCVLWFTAIDNIANGCKFHPGTPHLDPNAYVWSTFNDGSTPYDWNNDHGRKMFPNGFRWSCCGGLFSTPSHCVAQLHVAQDPDTFAI